MASIPRLIHYYYFIQNDTSGPRYITKDEITSIFQKIIHLNQQRNADRKHKDKSKHAITYTIDVKFHPTEEIITGKLLRIRTDVAPQLINFDDDNIEDFQIRDNQGIVETTHFIISYKRSKIYIALEYIQYGARIADLIRYIHFFKKLFVELKYLNVDIQWIIKDSLDSYPGRIGRVSNISACVVKNNLERVNNVNNGLFGGAHFAKDTSPLEFVEITQKVDIRRVGDTSFLRGVVNDFIRAFKKEPELSSQFMSFKVKAEDSKKGNKIETFDLLADKERSTVKVQRRGNTKVVVSESIFEEIKKEIANKDL